MQNKVLLRTLRKVMDFDSKEELESALSEVHGAVKDESVAEKFDEFREGLIESLDVIDQALTDLERTIDIRDRTVAVSSKELTILNDEISQQAERQKNALINLQNTVDLLKKTEATVDSETITTGLDLDSLVDTVKKLVESQMSHLEYLEKLFEEGLKISSMLDFKSLERQLEKSLKNLASHPVQVKLFFSGQLFGTGHDPLKFYTSDSKNKPVAELQLRTLLKDSAVRCLNVESPKGNGTLAVMALVSSMFNVNEEHILTGVQPILPNVAATLENIQLLREEKERLRLEGELQTARFVQQTLLPREANKVTSDIEVSGYYQSATECGGDWWTHFRLKDGRYIILVGDVTGHGTASAMICAVVKGYCESFYEREGISLSEILRELNDVIYQMSQSSSRAMTMVAISVDLKSNQLTIANAGHPHPLIVKSETPATKYLSCSGPILGIHDTPDYLEKDFEFALGDKVVLYSDGVTEYLNSEEDMYGDSRLFRVAKSLNKDVTAMECIDKLVRDIKDFAAGTPPEDDITAVVVKRVGLIT